MDRRAQAILLAIAMVALILILDVTVLRHDTTLRLIVNIAIVAAFGGFYLLVMRRR